MLQLRLNRLPGSFPGMATVWTTVKASNQQPQCKMKSFNSGFTDLLIWHNYNFNITRITHTNHIPNMYEGIIICNEKKQLQ